MPDTKIDKLGKYKNCDVQCLPVATYYSFTEKNIQHFMSFYRAEFPWATVLPKMQVMEDHTIPWLRKYRVGVGLMGEQGAESIHAQTMKLERDFQGIKDESSNSSSSTVSSISSSAELSSSEELPSSERRRRLRPQWSLVGIWLALHVGFL